jgi:predicted Zn-dependent protease with MMP-like domain
MGTKFSTHETVEDISYSNHNKILGETGVQKIATRSLKQNKSTQKITIKTNNIMPTKESEQKLDSIVTDFLYILISSK